MAGMTRKKRINGSGLLRRATERTSNWFVEGIDFTCYIGWIREVDATLRDTI